MNFMAFLLSIVTAFFNRLCEPKRGTKPNGKSPSQRIGLGRNASEEEWPVCWRRGRILSLTPTSDPRKGRQGAHEFAHVPVR